MKKHFGTNFIRAIRGRSRPSSFDLDSGDTLELACATSLRIDRFEGTDRCAIKRYRSSHVKVTSTRLREVPKKKEKVIWSGKYAVALSKRGRVDGVEMHCARVWSFSRAMISQSLY